MIIRAIDIGYGNVKLTLSNSSNNEMDTMLFPSEAIPINSNENELSGSFVTSKDIKKVSVCNKAFKVGVDALLLDSNNVHRNLHDDYIHQKSYMALYLGALSYMEISQIDVLVVGLPVRLMQRKHTELQAMLQGTHTLADGKIVEVKKVKVLHQPLGGFLNFSKNSDSRSTFLNSTNLIVDIGFYTMDWLVSKGLKPIDSRCDGNHYGSSRILDAVLKSVQLDEQLNTSIDSINYIDEAILNDQLKIRGKSFPIQPYLESADHIIDEAMRDLTNKLKSTDDIDNIIISGGGAHFYHQAIETQFPDYDILIDQDSIFSNVKGFQHAGEIIARSLLKEVA